MLCTHSLLMLFLLLPLFSSSFPPFLIPVSSPQHLGATTATRYGNDMQPRLHQSIGATHGKGKDLGTKEEVRFGSKKTKAPGDGIERSYKMSRQTGKCMLILVHTNSGTKKALTNVQIKRSLVIWEKYRCILLHDFLSPLAVSRSH